MVEATGLEPAASWSQTKHSTKLSYASKILIFAVLISQLLYYTAILQKSQALFLYLYKFTKSDSLCIELKVKTDKYLLF